MRPVFQTKFTNPSWQDTGDANCLMAVVASLLHRPLESIPDFGMSGIGWFEELHEWCQNEGIGILYFTEENLRNHGVCMGAYCMLVYSVKGWDVLHAVVGKTSLLKTEECPDPDETKWYWRVEIVHDPNPHGVDLDELKYFVFLIPTPSEPAYRKLAAQKGGLVRRGKTKLRNCARPGCGHGASWHTTPKKKNGYRRPCFSCRGRERDCPDFVEPEDKDKS